jgi:hypothetical protein
MRARFFLVVVAALCLGPITARAQFGGTAIFEPEIGIVNSGVAMDAQATVSADRKYVTMNMRAAQSQLLALHTFQFQSVGNGLGGVVGGVNPVIGGSGSGVVIPQQPNAPMRVMAGNGGAILLRRGITPLIVGN